MEVIDCTYHEVYREAVFKRMPACGLLENPDLPTVAESDIQESKRVWVPDDVEACRRLEIKGL